MTRQEHPTINQPVKEQSCFSGLAGPQGQTPTHSISAINFFSDEWLLPQWISRFLCNSVAELKCSCFIFHSSPFTLSAFPSSVHASRCSNANAVIKGLYVKMKALAEAAVGISDMHTHKHTHTHIAPTMLSYHALATPTDCSISPPVSPRLPAVARDTIAAACENLEKTGVAKVSLVRRRHLHVQNTTITGTNLCCSCYMWKTALMWVSLKLMFFINHKIGRRLSDKTCKTSLLC